MFADFSQLVAVDFIFAQLGSQPLDVSANKKPLFETYFDVPLHEFFLNELQFRSPIEHLAQFSFGAYFQFCVVPHFFAFSVDETKTSQEATSFSHMADVIPV